MEKNNNNKKGEKQNSCFSIEIKEEPQKIKLNSGKMICEQL